MNLRVPLDLPPTALRLGDLRAFLGVLPDDLMVVGDCAGPQGRCLTRLGWPMKASVLDESGRHVPVIALAQVHAADKFGMTVSRLHRLVADLPEEAPVVTAWRTPEGPRQTTVGTPEFGDLITNVTTGAAVRVVVLPGVLSGATGRAYDAIVDGFGLH